MVKYDFPCVDGLIEGVHYRVVDWSFAEGHERDRGLQTNMPSRGMASTFADGQGCPEGEKMVFGVCRKPGEKQGDKEFDSGSKTKQEEELEGEAKKQGSDAKNNKMIKDVKSGKKLGWAIKDGKPVLVEWGSVAGEKKVGPKAKAPKANPKGTTQNGVSDASRAGQLAGNTRAQAGQVNDAGRMAQEGNRRSLLTQTRAS